VLPHFRSGVILKHNSATTIWNLITPLTPKN
jgi:hypothetical protein